MRAPSQEIVNATLLEVFLLFSFLLLLVVATLDVDLTKMRTALRDARNKATKAQQEAESARNELLQASLVYKSNLLPDCPSQLITGQRCGVSTCFMRVVIRGRDELDVTINRDEPGFMKGQHFDFSRSSFQAKFNELSKHYKSKNCKLRAFIQDTSLSSKDDYKMAKSAVVGYFYLSEN